MGDMTLVRQIAVVHDGRISHAAGLVGEGVIAVWHGSSGEVQTEMCFFFILLASARAFSRSASSLSATWRKSSYVIT